MTSELISRRTALVGSVGTVVAGSLTLAGCGGGGGDGGGGNAQVRAINLTSDLSSVDIFANDNKQFSAQATDALSAYQGLEAKEYTLRVSKAGDAQPLLTGTYSLGKDQNYTAIVWGRETALRLSTLPENEDVNAIATGNARVRVFNATIDSGSMDVYFLSSPTAEPGEAAATQGGVTAGQLSSFRDVSAGTYRLVVTGAGDPSDVRLVIPAVALVTKTYATLVITSGASGVLVNGLLLAQQGAATSLKNTKARLRAVAGVNGAGVVNVTASGTTTVVGALRSPTLGRYILVDAGTVPVVVRVNGVVADSVNRVLTAGTDYTLLTYGTVASPLVRLIADDNRLPALNTRTKIRLVHGAAGAGAATLSVDFLALTTDVPPGTASGYTNIGATSATSTASTARIDVTSATAVDALYTQTGVVLLGGAVYTVFVLGGSATTQGFLSRDR